MANRAAVTGVSAKAATFLLVGSVLAFLISGYFWWDRVVNSPRNVFYGMLENSLSTTGVSRHIFQKSGSQTLEQTSFLQTGASKVAQSVTTITQDELGSTKVKTEGIGTPTADYVRYTLIETTQTADGGGPLDFSPVLGVWGRSGNAGGITSGELFGETVLGVVPFGYLPKPQRDKVVNFIRQNDVYGIDYAGAKSETRNGRPVYTYKAEVSPEHYVATLKMFATAVGLDQLERIDPDIFKDEPRMEFRLVIDVWSRQLLSLEQVGSGRTETFMAHGARRDVALPTQHIPIAELQARLQTIR